MFIPRLLVFRRLPQRSPVKATIPAGETVAPIDKKTVEANLRKQLFALIKKVRGLKPESITKTSFDDIMSSIWTLRSIMLNNGLMKGYVTPLADSAFSFLEKLSLASAAPKTQELTLYNPYTGRTFFKKRPKSLSFLTPKQLDDLQDLMFMLDPGLMISHYFESNPTKWSDTQLMVFLNAVLKSTQNNIADFLVNGKLNMKRIRLYRSLFSRLLKEKYNGDNEKLKTYLERLSTSFVPIMSLKPISEVYPGLSRKSLDLFVSAQSYLKRKAFALKSDAEFSSFMENEIGTYSNNPRLDKILQASGLPKDGGQRFPKLRAKLFARLLTPVYISLLQNPNVSKENAKKILLKEQALRRRFAIEIRLDSLTSSRDIAASVAKSLLSGGKSKAKPKRGPAKLPQPNILGVKPIIANLLALQAELGTKMYEEKLKKYSKLIDKLRDQLHKKFGFSMVFKTQEDRENYKKAQALIDHFEAFAAAIEDSKKLPKYKKQLDELNELDANNAKKFKALNSAERDVRFAELEALYLNLKSINYLPTKRDYSLHAGLLALAKSLYEKWCSFYKFTPKLTDNADHFMSDEAGPEDDGSRDFEYSPFFPNTGKEGLPSYEIPPMMSHQLNRLHFLATLAEQFLARSDVSSAFSRFSIGLDLDAVNKRLTDYYFRRNKNGPKFDGTTPFDLRGAINDSDDLHGFTTTVSDFFTGALNGTVTRSMAEKAGMTGYIAVYDLLKKNGHDAEEIAQHVSSLPYVNSLLRMLDFSQPYNPVDIKQAGYCLALFTRKELDDFETARDIMSNLLQPHMVASRRNVLKYKRNRDALMHNARSVAAAATLSMVKKIGPKMLKKFKEQMRRDLKAKTGKEPSNESVYFYAQQAYNAWLRDTRETLTTLRFEKELDWMAVSPRYFKPLGKLDETDARILAEYRDSLGQGDMFDAKDETLRDLKKIGEFWKEVAIEVALTVASIYIPGLIASKAVSLGRLALNAGRLARVAGIIAKLREAYETGRLLYYGVRVAGIVGQAAGFLAAYPTLNNVLVRTGIRGKKVETLFQTWQRYGWGRAVLRVLGEAAMFGSFHLVGFGAQFLKYGRAGRALHALRLNPKYAKEAEYVLKEINGAKTGQEGWKSVEKLLDRGIPAGRGRFDHLSKPVKEALEGAKGQVEQLRKRYFRLISEVEDDGLRDFLGLIIHDLGFDMVAMILGTVAKHNIYKGDQKELDLLNKDTLFQMFTMGLAFRATFVGIPKTFARFQKRFKTKSPMEAVQRATFELANAERHRAIVLEAIDSQTSKLETLYHRLEGRIVRMKATSPHKLALVKHKAKIAIQLQKSRARRLDAYRRNTSNIKALESALSKMKKLLAEAPLANYPVPSAIARLLPRPLREHLYRVYRDKDGLFLGSKGFADLCVNDWRAAKSILANAQRSILSPSEVIYVASKMSPVERIEFLTHMGRILTRSQAYAYKQFVQNLSPLHPKEYGGLPTDIKKLAVPRSVKRRGTRAVQNYRWRKWKERLVTLLMAGGVFLGGYNTAHARANESASRPRATYSAIVEDFRAPRKSLNGVKYNPKFYFTPSFLSKSPSATRLSRALVVRAKFTESTSGKGENSTLKTRPISSAKTLTRELPKFGKTADEQIKVQSGVIRVLAMSGVAKPVLFSMANWFGKLPDELKPFALVTASIPKGATGNNIRPDVYVIYDQQGYANFWAEKHDKSASEAPSIMATVAATNSDTNEVKVTGLFTGVEYVLKDARDIIFGGTQGNIVTQTLVGPENELTDVGRMENLRRYAHKHPWKSAYLFMWLTALGIRLIHRRRGIKEIKADREKRVALFERDFSTGWKSMGSILRIFGRIVARAHNYPWRRLGVAELKDAPVVAKSALPSLGKILRRSSPLSKEHMAELQETYDKIIKSDFTKLKFLEGGERKSIEVFKALIRNRYIEMRLEELRTELIGPRQHVGPRRGPDPRIVARALLREYDANTRMLQDVLMGDKDPFSVEFFAQTNDGPHIAARAITEMFMASKILKPAERSSFRKLTEKTLKKLARLYRSNPDLKGRFAELVRIEAYLKLNKTIYEATGPGSVKKLGRKYPLDSDGNLKDHPDFVDNPNLRARVIQAHAFILKYEAMSARRNVLLRDKKLLLKKAKAIVKSDLNRAAESPKYRAIVGLAAGALAVALIKMFTSGDHEEYEYGKKRVQIAGAPSTYKDHDDEARRKFQKMESDEDKTPIPSGPDNPDSSSQPVSIRPPHVPQSVIDALTGNNSKADAGTAAPSGTSSPAPRPAPRRNSADIIDEVLRDLDK